MDLLTVSKRINGFVYPTIKAHQCSTLISNYGKLCVPTLTFNKSLA